MKIVLSIVLVVAFAVLAAAQAAAPSVDITARTIQTDNGDVIRFRDVVVKANGLELRADEMDLTQGREATLRGNVRLVLAAPLTP